MPFDGLFPVTLLAATFFCSLVAGLLFVFAVVVMPGIGRLTDGEFLRAFQKMDRIIQENQPLFMLVWMGSVVALVAATALGVVQMGGVGRLLILVAAAAYLVGAQLPTMVVNIPLNNRVQTLDVRAMDAPAQETERRHFEARWTRWNAIRTVFASLASALLMVVLWIL